MVTSEPCGLERIILYENGNSEETLVTSEPCGLESYDDIIIIYIDAVTSEPCGLESVVFGFL